MKIKVFDSEGNFRREIIVKKDIVPKENIEDVTSKVVRPKIVKNEDICGGKFCDTRQRIGRSNRFVCKHNSVQGLYPDVAAEWNYDKNEKGPDSYTAKTTTKVWWICSYGHEWEARIDHRTNGSGCPCCSGRVACKENNLSISSPELASEWNYERNSKGPEHYKIASNVKVWWKCKKGHEWKAAINNRSGIYNNGCPYCFGRLPTKDNNLAVSNPKLILQWNYDKNDKRPEEYTPRTPQKVWWICEFGHEWYTSICTRNRPYSECIICANRNYSKMAIEWLEDIMQNENIHIQHAENGGEYLIEELSIRIDGYCKETNTVYEFHGDFWHGNPDVYPDQEMANRVNGKTYGFLYSKTVSKINSIKALGYNVVEMWENDYLKRGSTTLENTLTIQPSLLDN